MARSQQLGLDELMIVNPGEPSPEPYFFGEDGTLYQVQGLGEVQVPQGLAQYFLGEDGILYQVQDMGGFGSPFELGEDQSVGFGRFFLGADGTLYQVVQ